MTHIQRWKGPAPRLPALLSRTLVEDPMDLVQCRKCPAFVTPMKKTDEYRRSSLPDSEHDDGRSGIQTIGAMRGEQSENGAVKVRSRGATGSRAHL